MARIGGIDFNGTHETPRQTIARLKKSLAWCRSERAKSRPGSYYAETMTQWIASTVEGLESLGYTVADDGTVSKAK